MKRRRFQFSLLAFLGLTTFAAILLAAVQHEVGLVAIAGVYIAFFVWLTIVFGLSLLRDFWIATRRRSLEPFRLYASKRGAFALGMMLATCLGGLYWSFGAPPHEGLEELVGNHWSGACRKGALALGVCLALLHVRHRDFWASKEAAKAVTWANDKGVPPAAAADEVVE